jgi:selenide,water dikinase
VNGRVDPGRHWLKGPLREGDALLLSGPLGTGVLFAAAMAGAARSGWMDAALETMQRSQARLVELLAAHGCHACTDVTGFGLLGHLGEMLATGAGAAGGLPGDGLSAGETVLLEARSIPAFTGALELLDQGWASSLAPANGRALALLEGPVRLVGEAAAAVEALLIDPQTCGPLLATLPADRAGAALAALQRAGFPEAALIGRVLGAQDFSLRG